MQALRDVYFFCQTRVKIVHRNDEYTTNLTSVQIARKKFANLSQM